MSEDTQLIKRAQKGDAEAFGRLYDHYLTPIYRFILIRVRHKSEAEDITQQVFLRAWQSIGRYKQKRNIPFSSWLYKIAKNAVIDHFRTQRDHIDIEHLPEHALAQAAGLNEHTDTAIAFERVTVALTELTEDEQNVLIMKFIDERSYEEIAHVLDKSQGAVRVMQHRALKKLKEYFNE